MKHLTNIFRRVYRIFAHAWFQHREVFWQVEGSDGLYAFFKTVCDMYRLIPDDGYTIPPEAEGEEVPEKGQQDSREKREPRRMQILRKDDRAQPVTPSKEEVDPASLNVATQRRHRYSPSRPSSVATIAETAEDDEDEKSISADEPNLGSGSIAYTESPVEMERTSQSKGPESTLADSERIDMDKTPLNVGPSRGSEEKESRDKEEDIGAPGPEERHPESVVVIRPHPEAGRKSHHAEHPKEEKGQQEAQVGESSKQEQKGEEEVKAVQEAEQTQPESQPEHENESPEMSDKVTEKQDKPDDQPPEGKAEPTQESASQEGAKVTNAASEPAEVTEKAEEQSTEAKEEKPEAKVDDGAEEKADKSEDKT